MRIFIHLMIGQYSGMSFNASKNKYMIIKTKYMIICNKANTAYPNPYVNGETLLRTDGYLQQGMVIDQ